MKEKIYSIQWLHTKQASGDPMKYIYFWGHTQKDPTVIDRSCFSQWYESPFLVNNTLYKTAEHWMMAQKALLFKDDIIFQKIILSEKPGEAKALGRMVKNFDEKIWKDSSYDIVSEGNYHKFSQHQDLKNFLLTTSNRILVEASPVDPIWGIGMAADDPNILDVYKWKGLNLLGFALMEVRNKL
ncbi:MAG: NADAR family protein [Bacteroidota bacterium]|nr:NADAR family protein [Bacteroidota bacterium]